MGCNGSKARGKAPSRKIDDNTILREAGLQTLTREELKQFNCLWNLIFALDVDTNGGKIIQVDRMMNILLLKSGNETKLNYFL